MPIDDGFAAKKQANLIHVLEVELLQRRRLRDSRPQGLGCREGPGGRGSALASLTHGELKYAQHSSRRGAGLSAELVGEPEGPHEQADRDERCTDVSEVCGHHGRWAPFLIPSPCTTMSDMDLQSGMMWDKVGACLGVGASRTVYVGSVIRSIDARGSLSHSVGHENPPRTSYLGTLAIGGVLGQA